MLSPPLLSGGAHLNGRHKRLQLRSESALEKFQVEWLRALSALVEDLGSNPSTYNSQLSITLVLGGGSDTLFWLLWVMHAHYAFTRKTFIHIK